MTVRPSAHVAWRRIDDETFVINLERKIVYGLNEAGGELWSELEEGCDVNNLVKSAGQSKQTNDLTGPVHSFIDHLQELDLVTLDEELTQQTALPENFPDNLPIPRVTWQENMESFGYSCAQKPGQTPACTQVPSQ